MEAILLSTHTLILGIIGIYFRFFFFFFFFYMKVYCVYVLGSPHGGDSNEYTHLNILI